MDTNKYINSGILELYVSGALSEVEALEVYTLSIQYPEVKKEIETIEKAIAKLSSSAAPSQQVAFKVVDQKIKESASKVVDMSVRKSTNWSRYSGWAAAVVLGVGLTYTYYQNRTLQDQLRFNDLKNSTLEQQIANAKENSEELLKVFRGKNIVTVPLGGQAVSPNSYANAFWNKDEGIVYIDAVGLPEPPEGMEYQIWSLTLDPLTPTSMGLLSDFVDDENKVFAFSNPNESQAFGITLEPAGGSKTPTMEQLYALGVLKNS